MSAGYRAGIYPGGKNGDGVYQRIINLIPPHKVWVEACGGSAAITRHICAAEESYVIEVDPVQSECLREQLGSRAIVVHGDFIEKLGVAKPACVDSLLYIDPPYLVDVRTAGRTMYRYDWTVSDHISFLKWVVKRGERIIITHPTCDLYLSALPGWNRVAYQYMSRNGLRNDCIWMNYPAPERLHDYSYIGRDKTDRQRIQRKIDRELSKLSALNPLERNAIISAVNGRFK